MSPDKTEKNSSKKAPQKRKDRAAEIANTFEWLITAFILAFVFRAFVMEAFRIPTGSMADTLKGAHFRLRCLQCGYQYDHSFNPKSYRLPDDTIPSNKVPPPHTRCPVCGHDQLSNRAMPVANGDRILVLKCIYQFFEPKQWDVVVFKNPLNPRINYIKRLIGRPGETVQIIDGDIYIDGEISRKPSNVQNELWMPVYDNDYQPVRPEEPSFQYHSWQQPFKNGTDSKWKVNTDNPTLFYLDSPAEQINSLVYDTSVGNDFRATYAYDDVRDYRRMPYCSDFMVRFYVRSGRAEGCLGISLSKYETFYKARAEFDGSMVIEAVRNGEITELARKSIEAPVIDRPTLVKFANCDHQLIFQFGTEKLTYDLGRGPKDAGPWEAGIQSQAEIFGSGKLTLSHVAIFRDIHYTAREPQSNEPFEFKLEKDEFFVLGDNSPNSQDGRWWGSPGVGNNGLSYRIGVVPRDYLVGKALFVYWPSGFRAFDKSRFAIIPNVGRMRFIYGGSNKGD